MLAQDQPKSHGMTTVFKNYAFHGSVLTIVRIRMQNFFMILQKEILCISAGMFLNEKDLNLHNHYI